MLGSYYGIGSYRCDLLDGGVV